MASAATVAPSATASQKSSASANPTALDRASARYRAAQSRYRQAKAALKAIKRQIVPVDAFGNRKPRLRGWLHLATLPLCIAASIVLICIAPAGSVKAACAVYGASAMLLFGKNPKHFFPRARIRFVRYEGTEARVGARMNVIKDVMFEGRILQVTEKALEFVGSQIKERTYLGADTRFVTEPEYPEFAWKELIINAVAHRDYSIKGTDIQIKMFDDRITVESPGTLPGIVRLNNMRHVHFSRNPKIAQFLHEYEYVQEFG